MTLQDADPGDIPTFLDRRPFIGTFTNLKGFINCEHAMFRRYIKKDQPFVKTEAIEFGNNAHEAMEKRVGQGKVLPEPMKDWDKYATQFDQYDVQCELQLAINAKGQAVDFWAADCWFRGKIDVTVALNDKALLTDWKFGNPGSSRYEDVFELATNALLLKAKYPAIRTVVGRYIYPREDKIGQMHDLSDFQATWVEVNRLMALVAEKRKTGEWVKRKSGLCGWCSVSDCENHFVAEKRKA